MNDMKHKIIVLISCLSLLLSCNKEEGLQPDSVLRPIGSTEETRALDAWIEANITRPYGVRVIYRFNPNAATGDFTAYPPEVSKIKPVLETLKALFFELYNDPRVSHRPFLLEKTPINLYLYGGPNNDIYGIPLLYNKGAIPSDMFVYNVNTFRANNPADVYVLMRSVHHQFARRLMELFPYPHKRFAAISQSQYTHSMKGLETIFNSSPTEADKYRSRYYAQRNGFLTLYAMFNAESDFAENISLSLTESRKNIQHYFNEAAIPLPAEGPEQIAISEARARRAHNQIVAKYSIVEEYFKKDIEVSLSKLQLLSVKKTNEYLKQQ